MGKGPLSTVASAVDSRLSNMFGAWARMVARNPIPIIPACVLFAMIMGGNNLRIQRFQNFIVTDDGGNMLSKSNLQRAMGVLDTVKRMRTGSVAPSYCPDQAGDCVEQQWDFSQLCLKQHGDECAVMSVLNLWQQDAAVLESQTQDQIMSRINSPPAMFPPLDDLLGGIAHPGTALLVCLMVCATLFSMGGMDYILGNAIDAIGMVCFAFAVGISVDYSVHIGHNFMMQQGSDRVERVKLTLVEMGVPVFHGGFSTFLAVMTLATAVSYSMRLFFNKFASVCIFGLWHALFVLPCVLSFIGADPFDAHKTTAAGAGSKPGVVQVDPEPSKIDEAANGGP